MKLNEQLLRALCPRPRSGVAKQKAWDGYVAALLSEEAAKLFQRYEVTTNRRFAHVLSNWAHETGGFTIVWESGAYSADRIMQIFGVGKHSARVTAAEARKLAGNGPALFDRVYGIGNPKKAAELGNDRPGDGWKFRGCGIVQITGKRDHYRYAAQVGCPVNELEKPLNSIHAALLEWDSKGCNKWADTDDYVTVRKLINGGRNGLNDVRQYLAAAKTLLEQEWPERDEALPPDNTLRLGAEGPLVYWLQQQLMIHGYYVGELDSRFGAETEKQLMAWQKGHGFPVTGTFDPDDKEQLNALNITPVTPVDASPKRDVTARDLAERGSRTIGLTQRIKAFIRWVWAAATGVATGEAMGLQPVENIVSTGEKVQSLVGRSTALVGAPAAGPPTWIWVLLIILVVSGIAYLFAHKFEWLRVDDAQTGANMGR